MKQQTIDNVEIDSLPTLKKIDSGQTAGWILQIGLGILLGFSAIQQLHSKLPIDDVSFLLATMAVLVAAVPLPFIPRLNIPCSKIWNAFLIIGLVWYALFSVMSYIYFHRYTFFETADKPQAIATFTLSALPIALLIIILTRRTKHASAMPSWMFALLLFGIWGLPYNLQFGQLPIWILSFVIAYQAAFLARGVRVLLLAISIACLELLALSLSYYIAQPSFPRFGADSLAGPSTVGHYMLLIIGISVGSLIYASKKARFPAIIITGFFIVCLFLTQTRAALVGMLAGALFFILQQPRNSKIDRRIVISLVLVAIAVVLIVTMLTIARQPHEERGMMLVWAMREFAHSPLIGNGIGSWHSSYTEHLISAHLPLTEDHLHCHNIFGEILCNMGLVGLFIFVLVFYCCYKVFANARESLDNPAERNALIACAAGIFGFILSLAVDVIYWYQAVMPIIPALIGTWMGYMASKDSNSASYIVGTSNIKRYMFAITTVAGMALISILSAKSLPVNYQDYAKKLSHKWFVMGDAGELPFGDIQVRTINKSGKPIEGVTLTLHPYRKQCFSDKNGDCLFKHIRKIPVGQSNHLKLHCNGYKDQVTDFSQVEHGPTLLRITLEPLSKGQER
ncbi:O-antigen ligase family protein [bacterium]|nr:O-antigen ligase family protein [bacterium]